MPTATKLRFAPGNVVLQCYRIFSSAVGKFTHDVIKLPFSHLGLPRCKPGKFCYSQWWSLPSVKQTWQFTNWHFSSSTSSRKVTRVESEHHMDSRYTGKTPTNAWANRALCEWCSEDFWITGTFLGLSNHIGLLSYMVNCMWRHHVMADALRVTGLSITSRGPLKRPQYACWA